MELTRDEIIERSEKILGVTLPEWQRDNLVKCYEEFQKSIKDITYEPKIVLPRHCGRTIYQLWLYEFLLNDAGYDPKKICAVRFEDTGKDTVTSAVTGGTDE